MIIQIKVVFIIVIFISSIVVQKIFEEEERWWLMKIVNFYVYEEIWIKYLPSKVRNQVTGFVRLLLIIQ